MKNNKGEISIPMIITGIILIILGGIIIFMLTGENGLFVLKGSESAINRNELQEQNNSNIENTNELQEQNTTNTNNEAITIPVE